LLTMYVIKPIFYLYLIGLMLFASVFNWQYAKENGFIKWILLGEIVPTIQSTIWPYYVVKYIMSSNLMYSNTDNNQMNFPPDGQVKASFKEKAWWLTEYADLNLALDKAGGTISGSYLTGPQGTAVVRIKLERGSGNSLILKLDLPAESFISSEGDKFPSSDRVDFTFRDHDLDGMPDDVFSSFINIKGMKDKLSDDGFLQIRDSVDHTDFFLMWTINLAFSTNHFLHNKNSILQ
jgi:hypothetical protein